MPKLQMGVLDMPYQEESITTGDVAEILEDKYGIMENFFDLHKKDVAKVLGDSLGDAMETMMLGGPSAADPYKGGTEKINTMFRRFLSQREIEKLGIPGVPTKAALEGRSKRFKSGYAKDKTGNRTSRPSFIDTGQYESAFYSKVVR